MSDIVRTTRRGKVLEIVFDRPPVNAINRAASRALYAGQGVGLVGEVKPAADIVADTVAEARRLLARWADET